MTITNEQPKPAPAPIDEGQNVLDVTRLRIERGNDYRLRIRIGNGEWIGGVKVVAPFPFSARHEYVRLETPDGGEIGLIPDLGKLDGDSRRLVVEEIERHYFVPEIQRIFVLTSRYGVTTWDVETDRGRRRFEVPSRDDIRRLPDGQVLIRDADNNRYRIRNYHVLDAKSRNLLEPQL